MPLKGGGGGGYDNKGQHSTLSFPSGCSLRFTPSVLPKGQSVALPSGLRFVPLRLPKGRIVAPKGQNGGDKETLVAPLRGN